MEKPDKIVSYLWAFWWPDVSTVPYLPYLLNYPLVPTRDLLQLLYCEGLRSNLVLLCQTIEIFVAEFSMNVCVEVQITVLCNGGAFLVHPDPDPDLVFYEQNFLPIYWKNIQIFFIARDASSAEKHNMSSFFLSLLMGHFCLPGSESASIELILDLNPFSAINCSIYLFIYLLTQRALTSWYFTRKCDCMIFLSLSLSLTGNKEEMSVVPLRGEFSIFYWQCLPLNLQFVDLPVKS